jgi:hypothetical protein
MPVSGTTVYSMTALDMVTNAMIELGLLSSGDTPTASELEDGITRLNSMLKSWQLQGPDLWREEDVSVTVTANTTPTTLDATIRDVFSARFIGTNYERVLAKWERVEYLELPVKNTAGDPVVFYVSRQRDDLLLYVWPVPTSDTTLKLDAERIVNTVTAGTDEIDVPQHAYEAVWVNLAARLIPMFNSSGQAISADTCQRVEQHAGALFQLLMDDDRPESIFIGTR